MTRITTLSLIAVASMLTATASAQAAGLPVQIAGRSPAEVQNDIRSAARKVCADALRHDSFGDYDDTQAACVDKTVRATLHEVALADPTYQVADADAPRAR